MANDSCSSNSGVEQGNERRRKQVSMLTKWLKGDDIDERPMLTHTSPMFRNYLNRFGNFTDQEDRLANKGQRERTCFTDKHLKILEDWFQKSRTPDMKLRQTIASNLGLPYKTIQVWFQNRRAKERRLKKDGVNVENKVPLVTDTERKSPPKDTAHIVNRRPSNSSNENYKKSSESYRPILKKRIISPEMRQDSFTATTSSSDSASIVVQVVDSSSDNRATCNKHREEILEKDKGFTIIHIPESNHIVPNINTSTAEVQKELHKNATRNDEFLTSTTRRRNLGSINWDLVVRTYEALLSSKDANRLIANWLKKQNTERNLECQSLEENLNDFVHYCKNLSFCLGIS